MIRINLLPVREIKRRNKAKRQILFAALAFASFLVLLAAVGLYQMNTVDNLKTSIASLQKEKQQYTKVINEIKQMEKDKEILQTRIGVIKQLKQSSSLTVHVLDEVAALAPPNRMWLTALKQNASDLQINGMALDNRTIAKYMDDLNNSDYIQNVNLISSKLENFAGRDLKSFSLSCAAATPGSSPSQSIGKDAETKK